MTAATDQELPINKDLLFTHGTAESSDLPAARDFFENVLGLRCVRHSPVTQLVAGCIDFGIVNINAGDKLSPQGPENRWVIAAGDEAAVEEIHRKALESDFTREVGDIVREDDVTRFRVQDGDSNWWDVTSLSDMHYQEFFEKGDIA